MATADVSTMQLLGTSATQSLYYDFSNTEQFYLLTTATNQLTPTASKDAKAWYVNTATNHVPGNTFWGLWPMTQRYQHQFG
jgi:hypothetical protein